jgi:hypothetical protein
MATLGQRVGWFFNAPAEQPRGPRKVSVSSRTLAGGRSRVTHNGGMHGGAYDALWGVAVRPDREVDWRALNLDAQTLDRIGTADLVQMMADLSPEVSGALWHFIRFCNPGWEARALRPGTETEDKVGKARLDEFMKTLGERHGAPDVVWNMFFMTAFLRGAFFGELVGDENGRRPVDLVAIDPHAAEFREVDDPVLGSAWQLGQTWANQFRPIDAPTVRYVPVDPVPGVAPYGRSLVTPAIFSSLFLLSLLHDLRRVVAQQGYPRLDLEVKLEQLAESMPADIEDDPDKQDAWVEGVINDVATMYAQLQPDDAYVHTDVVKVNRPVGAVDASSLGAVDSLIRAVERMAIRGLKTMPLLMGSNEAVSETHANRQWEIHVAGIKALQHLAEQMIGHLLTLALQMQGLRSVVEFRFAELRASEALRDAQAEAAIIDNAKQKYLAGWISQEEASLEVTGHAADLPQPRVIDIVGGADIVDLSVAESGQELRGRPVLSYPALSHPDPARRTAALAEKMEEREDWRRALFAEMESAREALENVLAD